jgi:hypothetical protein
MTSTEMSARDQTETTMEGREGPDITQIVQIITWLPFIVSAFSLFARLGTKLSMHQSFGRDDWFIIVAQIVSLAQSISVSIAAVIGLGRPLDELEGDDIERILMAEYAGIPLILLTLALVKWSVSAFVKKLSPNRVHARIALAHDIVVALWVIAAIIPGLFQCSLPDPWNHLDNSDCIDRGGWWIFVTVGIILTEIWAIALVVYIIGGLQMKSTRKALFLGIFCTRLLVSVAAAVQLAIFLSVYPISVSTSNLWLSTLGNQVLVCLGITTACIPYLRPFMESLESGLLRVEDVPESREDLSGRCASSNLYFLSTVSSTRDN